MDDDARHHSGSLGFPDYGHYSYALALHGQHALDDMDMDNWKLFGQQDSSAMSLHHSADSQHLPTPTGAGPAAPRANPNPWSGFEGFSTAGGLLSVSPMAPTAPVAAAVPAPAAPTDGADDDAESTCDSDCSGSEICHDSTCSDDPAVCCEDETCLLKDDAPPSAGENMTSEDAIAAAAALASFVAQNMQPGQQQQPPQTSQNQVDQRQKQQQQLQHLQQQQNQLQDQQQHQQHQQQRQHQQQMQQQHQQQMQEQQQHQQQHQHQHQHQQMQQKMLTSSPFTPLNGQQNNHNDSLSLSSAPSCMQLGLWPDLCISPQFLTNYQHLREAHNPLQPTSCSASLCPVEDPSFYQECHIRHVADPPGGLFDNIDLDMLMNNHEHYHEGGVECGAKFSNGEAMIQHLWHEHRAAQLQGPMDPPPSFVSSVSPSVVSMPSHDMTRSPSLVTPAREPCTLFLPDASLPPAGASDESLPSMPQQETSVKTEAPSTEEKLSKSECLWCNTEGGTPCGQIFDEPADLHKHVLAAHTQKLGRDVGGSYSCGWHGCTRRAGAEKGGFAQKSKIERHMQVHTGNKPFTCDICFQSFSANQALLQHKLIHQDSKPLACEICGKTFRQHSALTMHIRTHTKVRPLKCPYCHKEFSESSNLSKHKRIHAGEGQYECQFPGCKRTFHRKDQLRRHSALHTRGTAAPVAALMPTSAPIAEQ